jgi:TyrR family helix-turn-helix protein
MPLNKAIEKLEYQLLIKTYKKYSSTRETAKILGISQSQVSRKLTKYNIYNASDENRDLQG